MARKTLPKVLSIRGVDTPVTWHTTQGADIDGDIAEIAIPVVDAGALGLASPRVLYSNILVSDSGKLRQAKANEIGATQDDIWRASTLISLQDKAEANETMVDDELLTRAVDKLDPENTGGAIKILESVTIDLDAETEEEGSMEDRIVKRVTEAVNPQAEKHSLADIDITTPEGRKEFKAYSVKLERDYYEGKTPEKPKKELSKEAQRIKDMPDEELLELDKNKLREAYINQ